MRSVIWLSGLAVALCFTGCSSEPAPAPNVTMECTREENADTITQHCANGDSDHSGDTAAAGGGQGPVDAEAPKQKTCVGFAPYTGTNTPCNFDNDCPVSQNPCEIQVCGAASVCTTVPSAPGTRFCGEDRICEFSLCCTL